MIAIQENISLKEKSWFKTGGPARFYAEPTTPEAFQETLAFARTNNLPIFVLGKGANILISDDGFSGLVIHPQLKNIEIAPHSADTVLVTAGAGVEMPSLISYCLDHAILGLEEFSGIPGTVGGSVYINLHYFEFLLAQFLVSAQVIHNKTGELTTVTTDWFNFGYNQSTLQTHDYYLVSATFKLTQGTPLDAAYARGRSVEIIRHREKRYPAKNTCGSFFRNFHDNEVSLTINNKKIIFVAYYLDKIGVKGALRVGGAIVSHQHANMLVNDGNATSTEIIQLARTMQEMVQQNFGITPKPECLLVGFKEYPLLS